MFLGIPLASSDTADSLEMTMLETISLAVIDALPSERLAEFEEVLAEGDEEKISAFIEAHVPQARDVIGPIIEDIHDSVLTFA